MSLGGLTPGITLNDVLFGVSLSRNENLANVFYLLGLIEAYSTGVPKMMRSYAGHHTQPMIEVSDNVFKITLPNRNAEKADLIIGEQEQMILSLFDTKGYIVRKDVEDVLVVSQSTAIRIVREMLRAGLIVSKGNGKNIRYYYP
jgi:ATP-dependent DNA helicase RecG